MIFDFNLVCFVYLCTFVTFGFYLITDINYPGGIKRSEVLSVSPNKEQKYISKNEICFNQLNNKVLELH